MYKSVFIEIENECFLKSFNFNLDVFNNKCFTESFTLLNQIFSLILLEILLTICSLMFNVVFLMDLTHHFLKSTGWF